MEKSLSLTVYIQICERLNVSVTIIKTLFWWIFWINRGIHAIYLCTEQIKTNQENEKSIITFL